jgi:hypothetical protein
MSYVKLRTQGRKVRNIQRNAAGLILIISIVSVMFTIFPGDVEALSSGRYPESPDTWNGMVITYSISGVDLSAPSDTPGYTWTRDFNGTITGSTVTVSGNLHQENGYGADATVYLAVGSASESASYSGSINETNPIWDQPFSLSVNVPSGAQYGSFSISMEGIYNAGGRGLVVEGSLTAQNGNSPTPTSTVTPQPSVPTPTPTAIANLDAIVISDMNREVEYYRSGHPDEWQFARIGTELYPGDHVKTGEDSFAKIVSGDFRIFKMGPDSEIEILPPPTPGTIIEFAAGKIWFNFKTIMSTGEFPAVRTSNLVTSIRGTVFVVESNDTSSTVKGIVDYVNVTSIFTGESTIIGPGQMVTATSNGLGPVATFDVAAEEAKWDTIGGESSNWLSNNMTLIVALAFVAVIVILVGVLLGVYRVRKRSKSSTPDGSSLYPPPPPPPP